MKALLGLLGALALLVCAPLPAVAQTAQPVTICKQITYTANGVPMPLTQTPNGLLCVQGSGDATATPPVTIQQTLTASAVQLAANPLTNGAIVEIPSTDTGTVCVGAVGVTTSTGYCMSVASGITAGSLGVNNTNLIYVIGTNTSDKLFVLGN